MTDAAWAQGMTELLVAFPEREQSTAHSGARSNVYRAYLDDLADEQWLYAVAQSIRTEKWFPPVARLRELAAEWAPSSAGHLAAHARTDEERERDRAQVRRGLAMIRAALEERMGVQLGDAVHSMPAAEGGGGKERG